MDAPSGKIPSFFKVFIPEHCSQKMQLPSSFTSYMKGKLPEGATFLRDRHGNIWPVDATRDENQFYFENGWVSFVEDNCIEMGHFLTFQFSDDYCYDFKHLDSTACEKEISGSFKFTVKQEELERERDVGEEFMEQEEDEEEEEEEEEGKYDDDEEEEEYDDDDDEYEEYEEFDGEEEEYDEEKEVKVDDYDVEDEDYDYEEEDTEVERINMTEPKKNFGSSSVHPKKAGTSMNWGKGKAAVKDEPGFKKIVSKGDKRRGVDIFESGLIARPKNPYFVAQVNPMKKRNELYIPLEVIKDHNLKFPREIIIHGDDGKEFRSRINTWGDGRKIATNGWRAFCRWHFVKEEHRCLCQFVKSNKLHISVLHFQAGKWRPIFEAES